MPISDKEKNAKQQEKYQAILMQMLRDDDNKYCVDCDAKGPRWASWNLGIFLCIRCAGIHRNLGVHISKVKSVNLDQWTAEQIASMQVMGNSKARAVYEANLPDNYRRPQTDSALEQFIRGKYEQRKWIAKEWIPPNITISPDLTDEEPVKEKTKKVETKAKETVKTTPKKADSERSVKKEEIKQPAAAQKPQPPATQPTLLLDFDDIPQSASNTSNESNNSFGPFIGISSFDAPLSTATTPTPVQQPQIQPASSSSNGLNELVTPTPQQQQQAQPQPIPPSNSDLVSELNQKKAPLDKKDILALFNAPPPQTAAAPGANVAAAQQYNMMQQNGLNQFAAAPGMYPQQQAHYQMPQQYYGMNVLQQQQQQQQHMPQMYPNQPQFAPMMQYNQQQNQFNNLQMQMTNLNLNNPSTTAQQPAFTWPNQIQQPPTTTTANNTQNLFNFNLTSLTNTTNSNQTTLSSNLWQ